MLFSFPDWSVSGTARAAGSSAGQPAPAEPVASAMPLTKSPSSLRRTFAVGLLISIAHLLQPIAHAAESPDPSQPYSATASNPVTHEAELLITVTAPYKTKLLRVWMPIPPTDNAQQLVSSEFSTFPVEVQPQIASEPVFGNKRWQQPDADSTNTSRRVTFGYDGVLHLVDTVKQPVVTQPQRVFYDAVGNVDSVKTPTGIPMRYYLDAIGRDTLVRSAITLPDTLAVLTKTWYDLADEDTLSRTYSALGRSDTLTVRQSYDLEGNLLSHATLASPDTNHLGWLTHTYTYDSLNRKTAEMPQDRP